MKFTINAIGYCIDIPEKDFSKHLMGDERDSFGNRKPLYEKLGELDGVADVDYDGHFGPYVFLTIEKEHDTAETKRKIREIIKKHLSMKKVVDITDDA